MLSPLVHIAKNIEGRKRMQRAQAAANVKIYMDGSTATVLRVTITSLLALANKKSVTHIDIGL